MDNLTDLELSKTRTELKQMFKAELLQEIETEKQAKEKEEINKHNEGINAQIKALEDRDKAIKGHVHSMAAAERMSIVTRVHKLKQQLR